jgi:hypothetical protein
MYSEEIEQKIKGLALEHVHGGSISTTTLLAEIKRPGYRTLQAQLIITSDDDDFIENTEPLVPIYESIGE